MERCIISFASKGREDYNKALERSIKEARKYYSGDMIYYSLDQGNKEIEDVFINSGLPQNCPTHQEVPYAFKPYLFKEAFDKGYEQVIWIDSTIVINRDLEPIFKAAKNRGVVAFHNLGHNLEAWISDKAIKNTGIDIKEDPYQIMACVVAFDISNPIGKKIFNEWFKLAQDNESFQNNPGSSPKFKAHRHDQACLSALLWKEQIKLLPYGPLCYTPHDQTKEFGETIYFINKAIKD